MDAYIHDSVCIVWTFSFAIAYTDRVGKLVSPPTYVSCDCACYNFGVSVIYVPKQQISWWLDYLSRCEKCFCCGARFVYYLSSVKTYGEVWLGIILKDLEWQVECNYTIHILYYLLYIKMFFTHTMHYFLLQSNKRKGIFSASDPILQCWCNQKNKAHNQYFVRLAFKFMRLKFWGQWWRPR